MHATLDGECLYTPFGMLWGSPTMTKLMDNAIQHSMAALECVARDISGDPNQTLGALMKTHGIKLAIPRSLDAAVEKAWGYASEVGRHLQEGREPSAEEAELVTTVCAAVVTYLVKRHDAGRLP